MESVVSDEVWVQLPERRLPRRRALGAVLAVLLMLVAVVAAGRAGLVGTRISSEGRGGEVTIGSGHFTEYLRLHNDGAFAATLGQVRLSVPWLALDEVALGPEAEVAAGRALPAALPAGEDVLLRLEVRVLDCRALDRSGMGLQLRLRGPLGIPTTVRPKPAGTVDVGAPGSYTYSGPTDPWEVGWGVQDAAEACGVRLPAAR